MDGSGDNFRWWLSVRRDRVASDEDRWVVAVTAFLEAIEDGADEAELVVDGFPEALTWVRGEPVPDVAEWLRRGGFSLRGSKRDWSGCGGLLSPRRAMRGDREIS